MSSIDFGSLPSDGIKFEALIHHLLREMGYRILEKPAIGTEGGRDILVERTLSDAMTERTERVVVQCKHFAVGGNNVGDRDVGVWQNAMTRYQAQGYLLVTDTHPTENLSRSFREFTLDKANNPKWAAFWDADEISALLHEYTQVRDTFFPLDRSSLSGVGELAYDVQSWLSAIHYEVTQVEIDPQTIELYSTVQVGALRVGIRVWCIDGEITAAHATDLLKKLDQNCSQGWLISDSRVSPRAREIAADNKTLSAFSFSEFLERIIWDPYFRNLRTSDKRDRISELYIDRGCFKPEIDDRGEERGRDNFASLDKYVDSWLRERGESQIALLGDFGSGKSWFCRHYANRQLGRFLQDPIRERVPLLLPLREFRGMNAEQLITSALAQHYRLPFVGNAYDIFQNLSKQGKLLLLLDGFDEISWRADRGELVQVVAEIRKLVTPRGKLLLTGRTEFF